MKERKKPKYDMEPRYVLLIMTMICIFLIFFSYKFSTLFGNIRTSLNSMIIPMQKGITTIGMSINNTIDRFEEADKLQDEIAALKAENERITREKERMEQSLYELERYKQLFALSDNYKTYPTVGANIIAKDTSGYYARFTLDKGYKDGIAVDMNVLADSGLVGIITEVGPHYSVVRSIIDDNNYVSAIVTKTEDNCIVCGNLELLSIGYIEIRDLSLNTEARNNYKVYTSPLSDKYLPDILIGYISNIQNENDGLTKTGYLTPVVDFEHLTTVLIVTQLKEDMREAE
ncbi:MAG: rod shape-determining protein MreC [Lachnospiraceae bacterium]|nr:rod shape-determining protein MreC [Lachnospiraceae bacterium]MBO4668559.1 rod shape-determining protein MreC [Lachnospiraceae bacterium]MBR5666820.1 rod shape-determining protein MreC [Lachnospiraceae bacterium]